MKFFSKLTTLGRILVTVVITALIVGAVFGGLKLAGVDVESLAQTTSSTSPKAKKGDCDITIIVDTYTGWAPIVWGNGGKVGTKESEFYKRFGLRINILNMDDFDACRAALKNGSADAAFVTLDSYPVEMSSTGTMTDMRYFMIHNFSAGADAIVVTKNINTVADLRGKRIAYSEGTASHSLLLNTMETAGIGYDEIKPTKTGYGSDVAQAFKAGQVDAAVVFTPDDEDCLAAIKGAKVLTSTKQANTLVTDGFIAKKDWLNKNSETVYKFIQALLWANSEITFNPSAYNEACKVFSEEFDVPLEFVTSTAKKINFATLQDNVNWFGLNPIYNGVTGESLYNKMSRIYTSIGLAETVVNWNKASTDTFIESLMDDNKLTNNQEAVATKTKQFTAPTQAMETAAEFSNKKVTINFPVNGSTLDYEAKTTIDHEFVSIAQQFNQVRIRVEGNTDNTGNYDYNVALSKKRAKAVVDYLVREYEMDPNRFIVVGNGPKKAVAAGVYGDSEAYRMTEFQLINE